MFLRWYIYATLYNHSTLFFFEFPRFTPVFSLILYVLCIISPGLILHCLASLSKHSASHKSWLVDGGGGDVADYFSISVRHDDGRQIDAAAPRV